MFDDLREAWITEAYLSYRGILVPSITKQLSTAGWVLDLDSLPVKPLPFKELFIRWLISINKARISNGESVLVTYSIIKACPLWKIIKCPMKKISLTKEGMLNRPQAGIGSIGSMGTIGTMKTIGSFNK